MLVLYQDSGIGRGFEKADRPSYGNPVAVYANNLTRTEAGELAKTLGLPVSLLSDVFDADELPRIELADGGRYIFLRNPEMRGSKLLTRPVLFIIKDNFFACLSTRQPLASALQAPPQDGRAASSMSLLSEGILAIAKHYEELIDGVGKHIASIEKRMRGHEATNEDFFDFVTVEGNLNRSKMSLTGLLAVVERLIEMAHEQENRELLDDIRLFTKQLLVEIASHTQAIESIRSAYSTVANNTLNVRMKGLTFLTLLMALPNVFYGMYGMNIPLPFMHEPWMYGAIVGFTILLMLAIYVFARRRKLF